MIDTLDLMTIRHDQRYENQQSAPKSLERRKLQDDTLPPDQVKYEIVQRDDQGKIIRTFIKTFLINPLSLP